MRTGGHGLLVLALVCGARLAAQSELVIVKEGTAQYHRPACSVVRDGRGVLAMTRAQAEARGFKAHPACDPATAPDPPAAPGDTRRSPQAQPPSPVFVYVAPGDNRYHRDSCRKLGADRKKITVDDAAERKYWPCGVCRPPVKKRSNAPAVPGRFNRG